MTVYAHQQLLIAGMGKTGRSIERFLTAQGIACLCCDQKLDDYPPCNDLIDRADWVFKSPGIPNQAFEKLASDQVINDIELLFRLTHRPMILVTGTNGKSTVVALVEQILKSCHWHAVACGNNGFPVMEAYQQKPAIYIIEVSSYQLENMLSHYCDVAAILNIGIDHVDRYRHQQHYQQTKERIYLYAKYQVIPVDHLGKPTYTQAIQGYRVDGVTYWLQDQHIYQDQKKCLAIDRMVLLGRHNHLNICAALAILHYLDLDNRLLEKAIYEFKGLPHRLQRVCQDQAQRLWINDSKSTNIHATSAALQSIAGPVTLIMGGQGKKENYLAFFQQFANDIDRLILFGESAQCIEQQARLVLPQSITVVDSVGEAVSQARDYKNHVLFSPAGASFDHYANFSERGDDFIQCVHRMGLC